MYNRYTPQPDGSYRRSREGMSGMPRRPQPPKEPPKAPHEEPKHAAPPQQAGPLPDVLQHLIPSGIDLEDLLVILLVLLICGDSADGRSSALLIIALYFSL